MGNFIDYYQAPQLRIRVRGRALGSPWPRAQGRSTPFGRSAPPLAVRPVWPTAPSGVAYCKAGQGAWILGQQRQRQVANSLARLVKMFCTAFREIWVSNLRT